MWFLRSGVTPEFAILKILATLIVIFLIMPFHEFAHGFVALKDNTIFQYKCDNPYDKASEGAMDWKSVGIDWEDFYDGTNFILSDKDLEHPELQDIDENELFNYTVNYYD